MKVSELFFKIASTCIVLLIGLFLFSPLIPGSQSFYFWLLGISSIIGFFCGIVALIWEVRLYRAPKEF